METTRHRDQMILLIHTLRDGLSAADVYVSGNMFVYFSETQSRRNDFRGPDVFVVLDTSRRERRSWVVWEEEGKTPDVVIELTSESTAEVDRGAKKALYASVLSVGEYFIFDPFSKQLEGFDLDGVRKRYEPKQPEANGRLLCRQLDLELGTHRSSYGDVETDWLRWFRRDGSLLPLANEIAETEKQRAETEKQRAETEKRRADALADRLRSLGVDPDAEP